MKLFKGFDKNLACRGHQYKQGETYEEPTANLCDSGFHACENPLDTLNYYSPADGSRYCKVDLDGVTDQTCDDSKRTGTKITVGAELDIRGLVHAAVKYIFKRATVTKDGQATTGDGANAATTGTRANAATTGDVANAATTGYVANAATTGTRANAATTGDWANAATSGTRANAATTGDGANAATSGTRANAATTGYGANAATSGYGANAATSGDWANAATTGDGANAATTGTRANAATTGDGANAATTGDGANAATSGTRANAATTGDVANAATKGLRSISAAIGINSAAKGALGNWIVVAEWLRGSDGWYPADVRAAKVDGETIKADTYYQLSAGRFVETEA